MHARVPIDRNSVEARILEAETAIELAMYHATHETFRSVGHLVDSDAKFGEYRLMNGEIVARIVVGDRNGLPMESPSDNPSTYTGAHGLRGEVQILDLKEARTRLNGLRGTNNEVTAAVVKGLTALEEKHGADAEQLRSDKAILKALLAMPARRAAA